MKKTRTAFLFVSAVLVAVALMAPAYLPAQEGKIVEYSYYKKAKETTDVAEKERLFLEFFQKYPDSEYYPYMIYEFRQYLTKFNQEKKMDKVIELVGKCADKAKADAAWELAQAYYAKEDFPSYLGIAEKIYEAKPSAELAMYISLAAFKGNDAARMEKFYAELEKTDNVKLKIDLYFTIFDYCKAKNDLPKAEEYGLKTVGVFEKAGFPASLEKPAGFPANADWNQYLTQVLSPCLGYVGYAHYKAEKFDTAIDLFTKEIRVQPKDAAAYYYIGLIYNKQQKMDLVGPYFAKAAALNVPTVSDKAKRFLQQLLNDNAKVNAEIAKAKEELGIQ